MEIIADATMQGGVGKTTTAVNLAYLSAASGWSTLLWDLDAQAGATHALGLDPVDDARAERVVRGRDEPQDAIVSTGYERLDLLPGDLSLRRIDERLADRKHPTRRLLKLSRTVRSRYAALFIDCAPGMSLLSENVLRAADAIVVPVVPSPLSVRMLDELAAFIAGHGWSDLVLLPFFSMVDRRRALHSEFIEETRRRLPCLLRTEVPDWSDIERMTQRRAPLPSFAPHSAASRVYVELWREIDARLQRERGPAEA
jgi:chromosome partitioning protein